MKRSPHCIERRSEYYFLLSQDHPEMSYIEMVSMLKSINRDYRLLYMEPGLAIIRFNNSIEDLGNISPAYIKEIGISLYIEPLRDGFTPYAAIRSLKMLFKCRSRVDIKIYSLGRRKLACDYTLIIKEIIEGREKIFSKDLKGIEVRGSEDSWECPTQISIIAGNIVVIGYPIATRIKYLKGDVEDRKYMRREDIVFMANIYSYLYNGKRKVFDLFSGYGYILDELCIRASPKIIIGSDIDPRKVAVSKKMVRHQCTFDLVVADAMYPPFRRACVDAIISDLPYGRRSKVYSDETLKLPISFLNRASDVLSEGSIVILALSLDQFRHLKTFLRDNPYYKLVSFCIQYVHGSLSRVYIILRFTQKTVTQ
ncbi:MAG: hypothetical protein QXE01_02080 [Sulfolobales archaeon]